MTLSVYKTKTVKAMRIARWAGVLLLATALLGCTPSERSDSTTHRWSLVMAWPKNLPGLAQAVDRFAARVGTMSNGRLSIRVYAAGELVPAFQVFDAVASGSAQIGHAAAYYWQGKIPAGVHFTSVPFGATGPQLNDWLHHGDGLKHWRSLYSKFGVRPYPGGNSGTQMMGWFRRSIDSIADMRGLKIRAPGQGGEVLARIGAAPVSIPGGELYTALQTGVVDAVEWVGPYNDRSLGLDAIAPNYYYPGWHEPGSELELLINQKAWDALPPDLQAIVDAAADALHLDMHGEFVAYNGPALRDLIERGVKLRRLPDGVLNALRDAAADIARESAAEDADYARISESFWSYLERLQHYGRHAEGSLVELRALQKQAHE